MRWACWAWNGSQCQISRPPASFSCLLCLALCCEESWIRCRQGLGCYVVELSRKRKNSIWEKKKYFVSCRNSLPIHPIPLHLEEWTTQGKSRTAAGQERGDSRAIRVALGWQRTLAREVQAWKAWSKELYHPSESQKWQSRFWKWIKCWLYWIS